jgi:ATP-dependent Clp protease ATP-binding subunit ClpA
LGVLPSGLSEKQSSVLLFDEVEKAHPEVLQTLLGLLDTGKIKDGKGKEWDASKCIIILTSNAWSSQTTTSSVGFNKQDSKPSQTDVNKQLQKYFSPEFLGRIDETIFFNSLTSDVIGAIIRKEINELTKTVGKKNICFEYDDKVIDFLISKHEKNKGARNVKRNIEKYILQPIAVKLLMLRDNENIVVKLDEGFIQDGNPVIETASIEKE